MTTILNDGLCGICDESATSQKVYKRAGCDFDSFVVVRRVEGDFAEDVDGEM